MIDRTARRFGTATLALLLALPAHAQGFGPYNADIAAGGAPLAKPVGTEGASIPATPAWTMQGWVEPRLLPAGTARLAGFGLTPTALTVPMLKAMTPPGATTVYERTSPDWPVQTRQMAGRLVPQDAWTRPRSRAPLPAPVARPAPRGPALAERAPGLFTVAGWRLAEAPKVRDDGATLSRPGYGARAWYAATVPGTVLTTLVDRGVHPDPAYGLNNLAIPESLARQDYWYRTEIDVPAATATQTRAGDEIATTLDLANPGPVAALATKLTVPNADGSEVLPGYFTDNYVSLLPGERRRIEIRYPAAKAKGKTTVTLRGWNVKPTTITIR